MRIELVGGLGVGKSTLCNALDKIGFNCIYETLETNPFLADCFADPKSFRFSSQMWFALSKFHEVLKAKDNGRVNVLDQSVLNVRAYTNVLFKNEDPRALGLINDCFAYLDEKAGKADILINLKCSAEEQLRRIRSRSRSYEANVGIEYVATLQNEINLLLAEARRNNTNVIDVDTQEIYLPGNFAFAEKLAVEIGGVSGIDISELMDAAFPRQYSLAG